MNEKKFTDMQIDALREIGTIGAGHAATALSKMIGKKVTIKVPFVTIVELEEAPKVVSSKDEVVDGVYFKLTGDVMGNSLILFPSKSARLLVNIITKEEAEPTKPITEDLEKSALTEAGNIIVSSYLTAWGSMTGLVLMSSVPYFAFDTAGAIFNSVLAVVGSTSDIALILRIELIAASKKLRCWLYLLPDIKSSAKILDVLGVK